MNKREYPYFGKSTLSGTIVRFTAPMTGEVVRAGSYGYRVGHHSTGWAETINFQPIEYIEKQENNEMQNLKKGDIIIGSQLKAGGAVSFNSSPKVQPNVFVANQEAERLAKLDASKKFLVVEVKGICTMPTPGPIWDK